MSETSRGEPLFDALRRTRANLAERERIPAYRVCSNATLLDMARKLPTTRAALLQVDGIAEKKAEKYGEPFLAVIRKYVGEA